MAKQKQDNKTIDIELLEGDKPPSFVVELLTMKDKIKELIKVYSEARDGSVESEFTVLYDFIIEDLEGLLEV